MNVSYQWLSEYIDLGGIEPQELAELLTRGGIEIDGVVSRNAGVTNTVVGYVLEKEKHPDADKLNVCKIDAGTGETLQIVCGAPNVAAGQKVPVALVGAKLPGDLQIKRAKLRGVESQGMICSARELGINDKLLPKELQEGILVLPADTAVGTDIADLLGLNDSVLELDLTPNRSDCLSLLGVAYETAALTGRPLALPEPDKALLPSADKTADAIAVAIESAEACSHYAMRVVKGVKIGPSPLWLQNRLIAAGIRPISNVVDVTNFVMLEYGQPLHAFDAAKVKGAVRVRFAREGETLVTLDGQARKLEPHMPVIADDERAIALAGVMGGLDTEVTPDTVDILLESARFAGAPVRKTSRQLGLRSEASARFEKGVDPERVRGALDRAASLIAQTAGGRVTDGVAEVRLASPEPAVIELSLDRINRMLGTSLSALEAKTIWSRLQFAAEPAGEGAWRITVPSRRGDITRGVDLIEEVARLNGYDRIPTTRIEGPTTTGALTKPQAIRRELRKLLSEAGLSEAVTYSVTSSGRAALFPELSGAAEGMRPIGLAMPMSEERSALRATLLPNLLEAAAYNKSRRNASAAVFEIASVYHSAEEKLTTLPAEHPRLAFLLTGNRIGAGWNQTATAYDFYDAKGIVEKLLARLGLAGAVRFEQAQPGDFHPGRTAALKLATASGEEIIGYVGQLHPELQREFDLGDAYAAEIELKPLYEAADSRIVYSTLPRFPSAERDLAVVVDGSVPGASLVEAARQAAGEWLESVRVFDVYAGERLGAGKKSVALSLVYRHPDRTLNDEEIAEAQQSVVARLEQSFSAELRK
ncbi:phenylalanine--tRNA ligase subunit beta [Cohnella rhizosphaerae]|uniref:Phenylalanine--tRNA ligase beta subunit n=1 Tax=Cohnella rhizosphaerae TaxID=1457232 RepID=A0A9X4KPK3_9BACL|nr:phenylalanine--tRNA ligase subunit beta [Cohnella rhizosphaerae]MDG0808729.1 phenylalanine--tRNA ligase subunit beta [Cohnella rhizosphaerae]